MKKKIVIVFLIASMISLVLLIRIHYMIYLDYLSSTGKNRALFSLTEYFNYSYRHYYIIIPAIGLLVSLIVSTKKELRKISLITALVSLVTIVFSIFNIWRLFT